jgi:ABC-type branched-subunit amino acid transport system substrate-binding protein
LWNDDIMLGRLFLVCFVLVCARGSAFAGEPSKKPSAEEAFFRARERRTEYAGPGRDDPAPPDVAEVLIGYFGPSDPNHPEGGDLWLATKWAVEEANREGGYRGKPFRLVPGWSENPWGTGVKEVVGMVYTEKVWAVVGGIDGPSTHLAEQVAAKARLTLISPVSTDKTVNLANVPWMFSLAPGDHLQAPQLARAIAEEAGHDRLVLVSADDHDSHLFAVELQRSLDARGIVPRYHFQCKHTATELAELVSHVVESEPANVAVIAGAEHSGRLVSALRGAGFNGKLFGGPAVGRRLFLGRAGAAAEGLFFPHLCARDEADDGFRSRFRSRFGRLPDYAAMNTYDAVRLLVDAIRRAGLNRARIRDALANRSPCRGAAGSIHWDPLGANTRAVRLGTIRDGRVVCVDEKM